MAAEDEIQTEEDRRPATDRPDMHRTPLRIQLRNFSRVFADFDWFGLFRRKRDHHPSGSQSDRPVAVRESLSWPEVKQLSVQKAVSHYNFQSVYPNEAKDWNFIDDDDKNT